MLVKKRNNYFAAGVILKYNNYYLLVLENKKKKWSFPKGKRDDNDIDSLRTALRELLEETKISIRRNDKNLKKSVSVKKCIFYEYEFEDVPDNIEFSKNVEILDIKWIHRDDLHNYNLNFLTELYFKHN